MSCSGGRTALTCAGCQGGHPPNLQQKNKKFVNFVEHLSRKERVRGSGGGAGKGLLHPGFKKVYLKGVFYGSGDLFEFLKSLQG